jgi:hypothetical protein
MGGVEYEYRVEVTDKDVTGFLTTPERLNAQYGPEPVPDDEERRLRLDTIDVLRSWLNRWTALTRVSEQAEYAQLTVRNTFTVLGQHLYATVFTGAVEEGLQAARRSARERSGTLRLLLSFHAAADTLAQLPWELLYADDDFLAKEHRLALSRNLLLEQGRVRTVPRDPPLVVKFLVTVPDTPAYREQRVNLLTALQQPAEYSSIVSRTLDHWDEAEAAELLKTPPYPQVVHVVGVCRRSRDYNNRGAMEIYLDDGETQRWQSPEVLVNLFRGNNELAPPDRVRLVVLHLCEPSPLDFEVTFERLAPALIRQGIPAVVAMQYPLSGNAAGRFVKKLYEGLAQRQSIEEAVQGARSDLFVRFEEDRLFGSPLLYMQSVDSQLLPLQTGSPAGADAGPSSVSTTQAPPRSTLDWLLLQLGTVNEPAGPRGEVERIVRSLGDWPPQLSEVERRLARQAREYAYRPDLARVFLALVKAVHNQMDERDA